MIITLNISQLITVVHVVCHIHSEQLIRWERAVTDQGIFSIHFKDDIAISTYKYTEWNNTASSHFQAKASFFSTCLNLCIHLWPLLFFLCADCIIQLFRFFVCQKKFCNIPLLLNFI